MIKNGVLKISDFGCSSNSTKLVTFVGTEMYMSPEMYLIDD